MITLHIAALVIIAGGLLLFFTVASYIRLRSILRSRHGDGVGEERPRRKGLSP